jgi:ribokinase
MSGLMHERVSTRWLVRDHRAPTGASSLISSHDRNAAVFTFRGANTLLEPEDLHDDAFVVDLVYVANLSNKSAEVFPSIVGKAKQFGARVAVNPGARQLAAYGESFCQCLPLIDILSLNRAEAGILLASLAGKAVKDEVAFDLPSEGVVAKAALKCLHGDGHDMTVATFLRTLTRLGPRYVVLTDGSRGAFVATPDEIVFCPALPCTVVGTAGAGDAFASTFAACIALGQTVQDAVRAATLNAGSVVGYADTQTGLMPRAPLDAAVKAAEENLPLWRLWRAATPRPERAENPAEEEPVT